jgi:hypothetical protein
MIINKKTKKKKSKAKSLLFQTGITSDDKKVMGGLYSCYETHGLPLDMLLSCCISNNWMPDWIDFYLAALAAGMKHCRILSKLEEAVSDSFGKEFCDVVISKLDIMFSERKP